MIGNENVLIMFTKGKTMLMLDQRLDINGDSVFKINTRSEVCVEKCS
jgi:hypothetical protein